MDFREFLISLSSSSTIGQRVQRIGQRRRTVTVVHVPDVIPIFPLPHIVPIPGEVLPLHIFEPRYREMVRDALLSNGIIGMIQILPGHEAEQLLDPPVREVGCACVIAKHSEFEDGRFLIWLVGVERFRIARELDTLTRYRLASICHEAESQSERQSAPSLARLTVLASLTAFLDGRMEGGETAVNELVRQLAKVDDEALAAVAAQLLGISGDRKQGLLEASSIEDRFSMVQGELDGALSERITLGKAWPRLLN